MTYAEIIAAWNAQADHMNQWGTLSEQEKVEWAWNCALTDAANDVNAFLLHGYDYTGNLTLANFIRSKRHKP